MMRWVGAAVAVDIDTFKYLVSMGVGGVLALVIFSVYRKDSHEWQEAWKGQSEMTLQVIKENTAAITALIARIDRFTSGR